MWHSQIEGLFYDDDFLNEDEMNELVKWFDNNEWKKFPYMNRKVQQYGFSYRYMPAGLIGDTKRGYQYTPIPDILLNVFDKIITKHNKLFSEKMYQSNKENIDKIPLDKWLETRKPDQFIINQYLRGQGISEHKDHTHFFDDFVVTISFLENINMTFKSKETYNVPLKMGSLAIMTGPARWDYTHAIDKNEVTKRRISLTMRFTKDYVNPSP